MNENNFRVTTGWRPRNNRYALILDVFIFVPGLALAGLVLALHHYTGQHGTPMFRGRLLMVLTIPSLAGLISALCRFKTTPFIAFISVAVYWGLLVPFAGVSLQGFALFFAMLAPLALLFAIAVYTSAFMVVRTGPIWPVLAVVLGLLVGIVAFGEVVGHWERERRASGSPGRTWDGPDSIGPEMATINKCTHLFYRLHPEAGYPASLGQMRPQGSGCLPQALVESKQKGFLLSYVPGVKDADGKVLGYTLKAVQGNGSPDLDFSVMSSDESGLIRHRIEGLFNRAYPHAYAPLAETVQDLVLCLRDGTTKYKEGADEYVQQCWGWTYLSRAYVMRAGSVRSACFAITYRFEHDDSGVISGFIATGRPVSYGNDCGIRSYLIEGAGSTMRMYATAEDRPARRSDPLAKMCEWRLYSDCDTPAEIK